MDVLDAGVYCYRYEAAIPRALKVVLWGPLHARELGFEGWTYQDGGETGFVYHSESRAVKLGRAGATLIAVRRLGRAFLTIYLAGYPSDAPGSQRRLDVQSLVTEAELFLSRLAAQAVSFEETDFVALVDRHDAPQVDHSSGATRPPAAAVFDV